MIVMSEKTAIFAVNKVSEVSRTEDLESAQRFQRLFSFTTVREVWGFRVSVSMYRIYHKYNRTPQP